MNTRSPIVAQYPQSACVQRALGTVGTSLSNNNPHLPQPYIIPDCILLL
jgi:hypothetical protein